MRKFILLATVALMATTGAALATTPVGHHTYVKVHAKAKGEVKVHTHGKSGFAMGQTTNTSGGSASATTVGGDLAKVMNGNTSSDAVTGASGDGGKASAKGEAEFLAKAKAGHHRRAWVRLESETKVHSWSDGKGNGTGAHAWSTGTGDSSSGPLGSTSNVGGTAGSTTFAVSSGGGGAGSSASASGGGSAGTH